MTADRPCIECGGEIDRSTRTTSVYCSDKCRYRHRDRLKYEADPEAARQKAREYYARNRERVIERVKRRRREKGVSDA